MDGVGEEVRKVCDENDQTGLSLGIASNVGELQRQRGDNADHDANEQTSEEDTKEDAKRLEQACNAQSLCAVLVLLCRLEQDNGNGVVENRLAKNQCV